MKVEMWPISRVVPYEKNPRQNDGAVAVVAGSIKEFGFRQPIVVDALPVDRRHVAAVVAHDGIYGDLFVRANLGPDRLLGLERRDCLIDPGMKLCAKRRIMTELPDGTIAMIAHHPCRSTKGSSLLNGVTCER